MHKLLFLLLLVSCASGSHLAEEEKHLSPEADILAPGMIPLQCEALLQKSLDWGYHPGENWQPKSSEQAREVAYFFSEFTLVPEATSRFWDIWKNSIPSKNESAAKKELEKILNAQICDISLTSTFMRGLIHYRWPNKSEYKKDYVLSFLLNQQARVTNLIVRALSLEILDQAIQKKLMKSPQKSSVNAIRKKLFAYREKLSELSKSNESAMNLEMATRKELEFSESIRLDIAKVLPLP